MKKVYQTTHDKYIGNCMQAAVASMFELKLNEVPDFINTPDWHRALFQFISMHDYDFDGTLYNSNDSMLRDPDFYKDKPLAKNRFHKLKEMEGVKGCFIAGVYSPKYYDQKDSSPATHAVVVDQDLNIVHDPSIDYADLEEYPQAEKLDYKGIIYILIINPKEDDTK